MEKPYKIEPLKMVGVNTVKGVLTSITFETEDNNVNEDTLINFITLVIDGKNVFVYPYREFIRVGDIPSFMKDFSKSHEIVMVVRKYGTFFFAFDYDFYEAYLRQIVQKEVDI